MNSTQLGEPPRSPTRAVAGKRRLPMYAEGTGSLASDGRRNFIHPADVSGRFSRLRALAFSALCVILVLLPVIEIGGHPAVFLDIDKREFYLLGSSFNAQDFGLAFFPLSGAGFALIVLTALYGRVWCGYACPHTVFLEGVFRPIERLLEGPRQERIRRNHGPASWDTLWRKTLKHALYVLVAFLIAHIVISYFVSLPRLYRMLLSAPGQHPTAFAWAMALTGLIYFNFSWFREQLCLVVCPYGRLQSVLTDRDTLVIGYDAVRGEPRGKVRDPGAGDCVDCNRCVVVCPTGIDIRNGLQIDCVGCARCIDACDAIMTRLDRPRGLIRYDSLNGFNRQLKHGWRPRLALYAALGALGLLASGLAFSSRHPFEANLLRLQGMPPFVLDGERVRNAFEIHLVNKRGQPATFQLSAEPRAELEYTIAMPKLALAPHAERRVPVFVAFSKGAVTVPAQAVIRVTDDHGEARTVSATLVAPR